MFPKHVDHSSTREKVGETLKFAKTSELEGTQRAEEICFLSAPTKSRPLPQERFPERGDEMHKYWWGGGENNFPTGGINQLSRQSVNTSARVQFILSQCGEIAVLSEPPLAGGSR